MAVITFDANLPPFPTSRPPTSKPPSRSKERVSPCASPKPRSAFHVVPVSSTRFVRPDARTGPCEFFPGADSPETAASYKADSAEGRPSDRHE
jgi:hypothetical protein